MNGTPGAGGSLAGVRVIDLTQMLAGPFCTQVLADQGADVIKIESPAGDLSRSVGAFRPADREHEFGGYFSSINRNKRSLVVDLKTPEGIEVMRALIADADVLVENYRVGVMDRLGLAYEKLRDINPRLVYAAIRGFGDPRTGDSPYQTWPAFDVIAQAMGGIMGITGPDAENPMKVGPGVGDLVPGLYAVIGILAALRHAQATGQGQFVDVAMTDCVLALCERIVHQYSVTGRAPQPLGNHHPMLCPFGLYKAQNGWVAIACPNDHFWKRLCELLGMPETATDPCFATAAARCRNNRVVQERVTAHTTRMTKQALADLLGGQVPFGPVLTAAEICADPHYRQRGMIVPLETPGIDPPIEVAGVPIRMTATPGGVMHRPPHLGEHTVAVLAEAGCSEQDIQRWHQSGAVRQWNHDSNRGDS